MGAGDFNISIKLNAGVTGTSDVKNLTISLKDLFSNAEKAGSGIQEIGKGGGGANLSEGLGIGKLVGGLTLAGLATQAITAAFSELKSAVADVVAEGLKMNEFLETSKFGIATSIQAQYELRDAQGQILTGQDAYNAALKLSEDQMKQIRIAGLETAATSQELVKSFQTAMAVSASQNITDLNKVRQLTVDVTNAATALGVSQAEVPTAIRGIITGREVEENTLARILVGTGAQVRLWQQQGVLLDKLNERLKDYSEGAKQAASSWAVVKSNIEETFQVFSGEVTSGLFDQLRNASNDALKGMFDTKNLGISEQFSAITATVKSMFDGIGVVIADSIKGGVALFQDINKYLVDNASYIDEWKQGFKEIWVAVKEVFKSVWDLAKAITGARKETGELSLMFTVISVALKTVALLVAGVADGVRVIGGSLIWVAGLLVDLVLQPLRMWLNQVGEGLNMVKQGWGDGLLSMGAKLDGIGAKVRDFGADVLAPIADGTGAVGKLRDSWENAGETAQKAEEKMTLAQAKKRIEAVKTNIEELQAAQNKLLKGSGDAASSKAYLENEARLKSLRIELGRVAALYPTVAAAKNPQKPKVGQGSQNAMAEADKNAKLAVLKAETDATIATAKDGLARQQRDLDYALSQQIISIEDYYSKRKAAQLQALKLEEDAARRSGEEKIDALETELSKLRAKSGSGTKDEQNQNATAQTKLSGEIAATRIKLQSDLNLLKQKEGDITTENTRKEEEAKRALTNKVLEIRSQLEQAMGQQTAETVAASVAEKFRAVREQMEKNVKEFPEGVGLVDRLINVETAKGKLAIIQKQYQDTLEAMRIKESEVQAQETAGTIGPIEAFQKISDLHTFTAQQLQALIPQMEAYAQAMGDPAMLNAVAKLKVELGEVGKAQSEVGKALGSGVTNSLGNFFNDLATGAKSGSDAVKDFGRSVLATFAQIMSQQLALMAMKAMFGGTAAGGFMGIGKADGGYISGPGTSTSDSIAARLSDGEYVVKASAVKRVGVGFLNMVNGITSNNGSHRYADGGPVTSSVGPAPQVNSSTKVVNVFDPSLLEDMMSTPKGEKAILNVIASNPQFMKAILA